MPVAGALGPGRGRAVYLAALVLFAAGSVVTATAQELPQLIAGRGLQGLAGGAMVPVAVSAAVEAAGARSAFAALGLVAAAQELGSLAGPVYGTAVTNWLGAFGGWRAIFWINLPLAALCAAGFALASRGATSSRAPAAPGTGARVRAAVALAAGLLLAVLALYSDDPARRPVSRFFIPFAAGAGIVLLVFLWEQLGGRAPLLSRASVRALPVAGGLLVSLLSGVGLAAVLAEVPLMARAMGDPSGFQSGYLLVWFLGGVPAGALAGGLFASRAGPGLPAGLGLALAAFILWRMSGWDAAAFASEPAAAIWPALTLVAGGAGFGLAIAPVTAAVVTAAVPEDRPAASAVVVLARTAGMLTGLAVLAAIGLHTAYDLLARCPPFSLAAPQAFSVCATAAASAQYREIFTLAGLTCLVAAVLALPALGGRRRPGLE